jgi:hypothetical protein
MSEGRTDPPMGWTVESYAPGLWQVKGPDRVLTWMEDTRELGVAACWRVHDAVGVESILQARRLYAQGWANAIGQDVEVVNFTPATFGAVLSELRKRALQPEQIEVLRRATAMLDEVAELGDRSDLYATVAELLPRARAMYMDLAKLLQGLE